VKVLVTRPAQQATQWVDDFRGLGIDAEALPLIDIQSAPESAAVTQAWSRLPQTRLVVFVSSNAAQHFFGMKPPGMAWPKNLEVASTGPGTTRALLAHGIAAACITEPAADSPQFDSESLWQRLQGKDWRGAEVLIVRGDGGREWLAQKLQSLGAKVNAVSAYRRAAPSFTPSQRVLLARAVAEPQLHLWLFSSSEAVSHLAQTLDNANLARAWAIATHPRIAARAEEVGFGNVMNTRPTLEAVAACIKLAESRTL
jgi:uroporphyrinogen-III synthase